MIIAISHIFYSHVLYDNVTNQIINRSAAIYPTDLRYDPTYIVAMHWLRTMFDGILPFVTLLFLNGKIFIGLKKVKNKIELHAKANLNTQTKIDGANEGATRNGGGSKREIG